MSGCIKICPFMFISALWRNHGSNFAKPILYIHVFLWLYSWDNLFCLYYKGFHYTFSSSCNPNLPTLSQSNHSCSGPCSELLKDVEIWKGDFSQLLILPKSSLWGSTRGFYGMYFQLLRGLKGDLCVQNRVGEIDTLGRLQTRLGSQRGWGNILINTFVCFSSVVMQAMSYLIMHLVLVLESEVKRLFYTGSVLELIHPIFYFVHCTMVLCVVLRWRLC